MILPSWYQKQRDALVASPVQGLQAQRDAAHQLCMASGLPNNKSAFWRYTNLADWLPDEPKANDPDLTMQQAVFSDVQQLFVSHQGIKCTTVPLSDGITCNDVSQDADAWQALSALYDLSISDGMSAMSWALSHGVYWLRVPSNTTVNLPIAWMHHLMGQPLQASTQIRLFIEVGAGSQVCFYESLQGQAHGHWYQVHVQWHLHEDAKVRLYQQQSFAGGCCSVHHQVSQGKGSRFDAAILQLGSSRARCVLDHALAGERAKSSILGLARSQGQQRCDFVVRAKHQAKATHSSVHHRSMVDGCSESAFNAKVLVTKDAPGSHAHQSNQNMVLADTARAHAKPALEIYHDDVVCSHGATVGALSDEAMFFLRSRGIPEQMARSMLMTAFCESIVDQLWDVQAQKLWQHCLSEMTHQQPQKGVYDAA